MDKTNRKTLNLEHVDRDLYNNTQKIVLEIMEDLLNKPEYQHICTCHQCLKDIASYTLNRLPAKYIANHPEKLETKILEFENKVNINVLTILKKAIKVVSNHPNHDC